MPDHYSSILNAPGSNFGLGRMKPEQGRAIASLLAELTPAGDFMAMGRGIMNRDPLEFGLGAASLALPGTLPPSLLGMIDQPTKEMQRRLMELMKRKNPGSLLEPAPAGLMSREANQPIGQPLAVVAPTMRNRLTRTEQKFFDSFSDGDWAELMDEVPSARVRNGQLEVAENDVDALSNYFEYFHTTEPVKSGGEGLDKIPPRFRDGSFIKKFFD